MTPQEIDKITRIMCKLMAGVIFTERELHSYDAICNYVQKLIGDIGESGDAKKTVNFMISSGIIVLDRQANGREWYRHTLPRTIQANFPTLKS